MLGKIFDPKEIEEKHYQDWESSGVFACDPASNKKPFTTMMPPPNVTGSLHMGHALNMTIQDVLTRYHRMNGKDALWQPGTDHAGIATQMVVERMLDEEGTSRHDLGREKFLERVWKWKEESGGTIVRQLRRLGATPDWARERFTMDDGLSKAVTKVFVTLYEEGLIYRDKRLVNWDPKLHTAISDLEVEQKQQKGKLWHLKYPVEGEEAETITVATTRPETMLGDTAVAVHPEDERYTHLIGRSVCLPLTGRMIPIVADEHADPEQGSGAVKITPAHDFNDFEVGQRHDLPMINIFDEDARILPLEDIPEGYHGIDRFEARKKILAELDEMDVLAGEEDTVHAVPYGDRSGVVIEPFLTDQWYCDAEKLAQPAIEAVKSGKTVFVPKNWENTYFEWMNNIQPWCISRQLWWGHQIPAWYGPIWHPDIPQSDKFYSGGQVFVAETEAEALEQAKEYYNKHGGKDITVEINKGDENQIETEGSGQVTKVRIARDDDVLDTWFSSALWPFSTLGWPDDVPEVKRYYPGDVLVTGFDIIFFWVARMMMMGIHFMGEVPFDKVYIHALVRDAKGQKMSKSKGNVMDPLELIDKFGTDALRFTLVAMAAQGRDIKLSEDRVEGYRNFATKLWNAARYCEMNDCRPDPAFDPASVTYTPNKWIISTLCDVKTAIEQSMEEYRFNEGAGAIYQFVWGTFCDWYLEFTKPLLQNENDLSDEIRKTTGWVLDQVLTLLNPYMPYITEELYAAMGKRAKDEVLISAGWPEYDEGLKDPEASKKMDWLIRMISEIRSVRADMNVPGGAKINLMVKDASETTKDGLTSFEEILKRMARLEKIELSDEAPKGSVQTVVGEATLVLPISDIIDLDQEKKRLGKQIEKLTEDIQKISQKLENKQFVENAPEDVVSEHRDRMHEAESVRQKLSQALEQLEAA